MVTWGSIGLPRFFIAFFGTPLAPFWYILRASKRRNLLQG